LSFCYFLVYMSILYQFYRFSAICASTLSIIEEKLAKKIVQYCTRVNE
jgi:hypothetical protein